MEGGAEDGEEEKRRGAEDGEEHCSGGDQPRAALSDGLFGGCRPLFFGLSDVLFGGGRPLFFSE